MAQRNTYKISAFSPERNHEDELILNSLERNKILHDGGPTQNLNSNILGRGKYGIVIKAIYKSKTVAVKIIKHLNIYRWQTVRNESNILNWRHPNIIQLLKIESTEKFSILVMEHFNGHCLQNILDAFEIPLILRIRIAKDVLEALIYCHNHDVLHMDIKPQNILVDFTKSTIQLNAVFPLVGTTCVCKLCDFGSSLKISQQTMNTKGIIKGTLRYMAPEALREEFLGPAADIFSFGITLWQVKSRQLPYDWLLCNDTVAYQVVKYDLRPNSLDCNTSIHNEPFPKNNIKTFQNGCVCLQQQQQQPDLSQHSMKDVHHIVNRNKCMDLLNTVPKTNKMRTKDLGKRTALKEINGNRSILRQLNKYERKTISQHNCDSFSNELVDFDYLLMSNFQSSCSRDISMKEKSYEEIYKGCWSSRSTDRPTVTQIKQRLNSLL